MEREYITQHLRVHTELVPEEQETNKKKPVYKKQEYWYDRWLPGYLYQYYLVFDTETTTDASQDLRFGTYELHGLTTTTLFAHFSIDQDPKELPETLCDSLVDQGIFYAETLPDTEIALIQEYAQERNIRCITSDEFLDLFYAYAHNREYYTLVIGHNLAFDLTRFSREWQEAKGQFDNGFSIKLCSCVWERKEHDGKRKRKRSIGDSCRKHPNIRIKSISPKADLYEFADRKPRGNFLDTATLASALLGPGSLSLKALGEILDIPDKKLLQDSQGEAIAHGASLTKDYIAYAVRDTRATWQIFQKLRSLYRAYNFSQRMHKIYSEASMGKALYRELSITPPLARMKNIAPETHGYAMTAYYGGRSEIHWRNEPVEVLYCDFKSEYPTVFSLMGLQSMLLAKRYKPMDVTETVSKWLHNFDLYQLQDASYWWYLRKLCKIRGSHLILPVRAQFAGQDTNIAVCNVNVCNPVWYTLSDVLANLLLGGDMPEVTEAIEIQPRGIIATTALEMFNGLVRLDPANTDIFATLIDERTRLKILSKQDIPDREKYARAQQALKLLANSTSYGINIEMRMEKYDRPVRVYGNDAPYISGTPMLQVPGKFYCPEIGTHIPAGGRLLLAMAQKLGQENGLTYALCDTDSMAFIRPDDMERATFHERVQAIIDCFTPLSPYKDKPAIFELEDVNSWQGTPEPLYCLAVSAKRYVLYNRKHDGTYRIRKVSAHGLGAYQISEYTPPIGIPEPEIGLREMGLSAYQRWIHDLWYAHIFERERERAAYVV